MMFSVLVPLVLSVLSFCQAGILTEEQMSKLVELHTQCAKETGVDMGLLMKAKTGEYAEDPKLKEQIFCFHKKAGMQNDAGDFNNDNVKKQLMDVTKDEKKTKEIMDKCLVKKDTPVNTAFESAKCIHAFVPKTETL